MDFREVSGKKGERNVHRGLEEVGGLELGDKGLEARTVINTNVGENNREDLDEGWCHVEKNPE